MLSRATPGLFAHAPPMGVQRRLGLITGDELRAGRRALLAVLVGWLPLLALTALQGSDGLASLLREIGLHARYLVTVPLLIIAEGPCAATLSATLRYFIESGLVAETEHHRFEAAIASTRRQLESPAAEIVVFALAYLVSAITVLSHAPDQLPGWFGSASGRSAAGWWYVLVSLPLLLVVVLGWLWRLVLWARLLTRIARLELRLIASHPDHAAGLGFLGHSLRGFALVAFALATMVAARTARHVLEAGTLPTPDLWFNAGALLTLLALFAAPLLAFVPTLLRAWQRGTLAYGALAGRIGAAFEHKWLGTAADRDALARPDFSATADLYGVAANVYALRFVPIDLKNLAALAAALLAPFVPVVFLAIPVDVLLGSLRSLLL
jgi:hypothetical protein